MMRDFQRMTVLFAFATLISLFTITSVDAQTTSEITDRIRPRGHLREQPNRDQEHNDKFLPWPALDEPKRRLPPDRRPGDKFHRRPFGRDRRGPEHKPDPELIEKAMGVLQQELPEYYERLNSLRESEPARFEKGIHRLLPLLREFIILRDRDPEMARTVIEEFKLEKQLRRVSKAYQEAAGDITKSNELETQLNQLVRQQIEIQFKRREARLNDLAQRLAEEQKRFQEDQSAMEDLVRNRTEQVKRGDFRGIMRPPPPGPGRHGPPPGERGHRPPDGFGPGEPPSDEFGNPPPEEFGGPSPHDEFDRPPPPRDGPPPEDEELEAPADEFE